MPRGRLRSAVLSFLLALALPFTAPQAQGPISLLDIENGIGGFVLNGTYITGRLGQSVSAIGDMNGDGFDDFVTGAMFADPGVGSEGQSYVVFGANSTAAVSAAQLESGNPRGFVINGIVPSDFSGEAVAGVGDVNGDGIPDVAIGALYAEVDDQSDAGEVYVVFGKSNSTPVEASDIVAGIGGFVLTGITIPNNNQSSRLGFQIDGIGDMNGDGFDDIVVAAPDRRRVYVVFGKSDTARVDMEDIEIGVGGFYIFESPSGDGSNEDRVTGAGDINGDGLPDILICDNFRTANGRDNAGQAYVVFGKTDTASVNLTDIVAGTGGFAIYGPRVDAFISKASGAGDVNGDGLGDIVVGIPGAYVVFGKTTTTPVDLLDVEGGIGGYHINGGGFDVSSAGDANGDGLADVLVGDWAANNTGRAFVVFGKTTGTVIDVADVAANIGGFGINAPFNNRFVFGDFGISLDFADLNGDGRPDVIGGAPEEAVTFEINYDEGRAWAIFNPLTPATTASYKARTRIGDGPGGTVVPPTAPTTSRAVIDFSDDDTADNGAGAASTETVTLTRSGASVMNLPTRNARVLWQVATDRTGFSSAEVTFRYTPAEVSHLVESSLRLYRANAPAGPWTLVSASPNTGRNEISAVVASLGYFAIGGNSIVPNSQTWVDFDFNGTEIGTQIAPFNSVAEAAQFVVANGTINFDAGATDETITLAKPLTLVSTGGTARIGDQSARALRTMPQSDVGFRANNN